MIKQIFIMILVLLISRETTLIAQSVTIQTDSICQFDTTNIPISINTTTAVSAISFTINYDTSALEYVAVSNLNNVLTNHGVSIANAVGTQMRFTWFANSATAITVSDTLLHLQFIGKTQGLQNLTWDTIPNNVEIADNNGNPIPTQYNAGTAFVDLGIVGSLIPTQTTICKGEMINVTATGGDHYDFYLNNNSVQSGALNLYTTDSLQQNDVVSVIVSNNSGCQLSLQAPAITVYDLPTATLTKDTAVCFGSRASLSLNYTPTGEHTATYNNITLHNLIGGFKEVVVSPTTTTQYILQSIQNVSTGCVNTTQDTVTVTVYPLPTIDLGVDTNICSIDTVFMDAGAGYSYLWSTGATSQTIFATEQTRSYTVTITDDKGCENMDTRIVNVDCFNLTGVLQYDNTSNTKLANVTMTLIDSKGKAITLPANSTGNHVQTDGDGVYLFTRVPFGNYTLNADINYPHGGLDPNDSDLILGVTIQANKLSRIRLQAADVTADGEVNSTDALFVSKRLNGLSSSFPSGDWTYERKAIILNQDINHLIKALCFGDVNGSYIP